MIPSLVSDAENAFLISIPSTDDIHDAIFAMDAASAPGPDGFSGGFYQRCWEVVGSDMVFAVHDFFRRGYISELELQFHSSSSEAKGFDFSRSVSSYCA